VRGKLRVQVPSLLDQVDTAQEMAAAIERWQEYRQLLQG
jgi:hypothetical protein